MANKKLPVGIQNLNKIINGNYVYVDKTQFVLQLINSGTQYYFLSRPRRFGKSLCVNTLEEVFKGNKELFKDFFIYKSDYTWPQYPVLHFDFSRIDHTTSEEFTESLKQKLEEYAAQHKIFFKAATLKKSMEKLIIALSEKSDNVVILIDEYDNPIINNLHNSKTAEKNRDVLKKFFSMLKGLDKYIRFVFVTGVSKFSQVSLFSGPNNITDITMDHRYADMLGYTQKELEENFKGHIQDIAKRESVSEKSILGTIKDWYNGYRFSEDEVCVYNPYSTLRYLDLGKGPKSFWYSSGTPTFLIEELKKRPETVTRLENIDALEASLSDISKVDRIDIAALMFQTGYLTIRDYNIEESSYRLGFPNKEVKNAFFQSLLKEFVQTNPPRSGLSLQQTNQNTLFF